MSELSPVSELSSGLRKHYESVLARQGGNTLLIGSVLGYFALCYGASLVIHDAIYQLLADLVLLVAIFLYHKNQRREEIEGQRVAAQAMPDDQLTTAYTEHQKSAQRTGFLWAIALIAVALGLLFTPQGNVIFNAALEGFNRGLK